MGPFLRISRVMNLAQHKSLDRTTSLDRPRTQFEVKQDLLRGLLYSLPGANFFDHLLGSNLRTRLGVNMGVPLMRPEKREEMITAMVESEVPEVGFY